MVWKCQNEISPIFYYGISEKTNEKDLKIPNIQPPDWKNPYWMSLYIYYYWFFGAQMSCDWGRACHLTPKIDSDRYIYKFGY